MKLKNLQTQVMMDQVNACKAEILVYGREIEKHLVKASVQAVEGETAALANCFAMNASPIDM